MHIQDTGTLTFVGKSGWTANEELQLLQGIEKYGYGNWELIANEIKTKTPDGTFFCNFLIEIWPRTKYNVFVALNVLLRIIIQK